MRNRVIECALRTGGRQLALKDVPPSPEDDPSLMYRVWKCCHDLGLINRADGCTTTLHLGRAQVFDMLLAEVKCRGVKVEDMPHLARSRLMAGLYSATESLRLDAARHEKISGLVSDLLSV